MTGNTQKLSIRLLRVGLSPEDGLREGAAIDDWTKIEGSKIALGTMGGGSPKWSKFLDLTDEEKEKAKLRNTTAYGVVFVAAAGRWFAVSFGMGHVKLDPAKFEQDFGLRVVLNAVDPKQLKSADVRTPDENTLSRRSQTSRGSDQTAFAIDIERDIVRGLAGKPKDPAFASRVAGTDALSMDRKLVAGDLPAVCADAYAVYQKTDYKADFGWIDQIRHIRDDALIIKLDAQVVAALNAAVTRASVDGLHLAFPVIYDPEHATQLRYKGFRSWNLYPDLEIAGYLDALHERGKDSYTFDDLHSHTVHEVDDDGKDCGGKWQIYECLGFETDFEGHRYVLSGGRWYQIDPDLARDVQEFFDRAPRVNLPPAVTDENEERYNARVAGLGIDLLCLDRRLIKPTGAMTAIEICDFIHREKHLVHVKDKTSSSRLSHLFSQGTVSARVLIVDGPSRDKTLAQIAAMEKSTRQTGFCALIPRSTEEFRPGEFTVVYAVLATGSIERLPFFSLVSFRQAARELHALGYKYAFAWIEKSIGKSTKKKKPAAPMVAAGVLEEVA
jgi:uncharacterized protein (TIGR04141 family)